MPQDIDNRGPRTEEGADSAPDSREVVPFPHRRVRFDDYVVDFSVHKLLRNGNRVRLQGKPFQMLEVLIERAGEIVSREELQQRLWPDTVVEYDKNLYTTLNKLRLALKDDAENPRFVQTVARVGYRFLAPVQPVAADETATVDQCLRQSPVTPSQGEDRPDPLRLSKGFYWISRASLVAAVVILAFLFLPFHSGPQPGEARQYLLVVPFNNLTDDPDKEFFSEGLTEETISRLGQLNPQKLAVISKASSSIFKRSNRSLAEARKELGADYALEGSFRSENGRVRLTFRLTDTRDLGIIWTEAYERNLDDQINLQREVAGEVARALSVELLPGQPRMFHTSAEIHEQYLRGSHELSRRNPRSIRKAAQYFEEVIAADPSYGPGYVGLGTAHLLLAGSFTAPREETFATANVMIGKALQLDPNYAEAHAAAGLSAWQGDLDWTKAEQAFRRAIEIHPNYATAHHWYAVFLSAQGRPREALTHFRTAQRLDPLSLIVGAAHGVALYNNREFDSAIRTWDRIVDLYPRALWVHFLLSKAHLLKGEDAKAVAAWRIGARNHGWGELAVRKVEKAFASRGREGFLRAARGEFEKHLQEDPRFALEIAVLSNHLGETDSALNWLERTRQEYPSALLNLRAAPDLANLHHNARFKELARWLGLPT